MHAHTESKRPPTGHFRVLGLSNLSISVSEFGGRRGFLGSFIAKILVGGERERKGGQLPKRF